MKNTIKLLTLCSLFGINNGFGQFSDRTIIDSDAIGITEIITADLNNDSFEDIVVSQKFSQNNQIGFYLNQGNGTFENQQIIANGINFPLSVASEDLDGNGWKDIVTFESFTNNGKLFLYKNDSGEFSSQIILDSEIYQPKKVKIDDINNDNHKDIILIADTALIIYLNDGSGNFEKSIIPSGLNTEFYDLQVVDIDTDGFKDIIVGGVKTIVYKNTEGVISYDAERTESIPDNHHLVFLINSNDFDNDGDFDLLVENAAANSLKWYENDGQGNFSSPKEIDSNIQQCLSITSNDFDNDGDIDLFTALPQVGKLVWFENDGEGNFSTQNLVYQGNLPFTDQVFSSDLNNDNLPDILWSQELSVHLNNSDNLNINEFDNEIKIYPNPTSNQLIINIEKDKSTLNVFNNLGHAVISNFSLNKGENKMELNLDSGIYFMSIKQGSKSFTKSIYILN
ncbi:T9SS type A sorting domain-containing protein [Aureivirga sp. CE67]|uniref:T9SS type A sorting domain-containing protein n=1 Tax=Aureivirga sp. CE67 TaxID=1788983 RepID=UPI0018C9596D|nr:T9SS type A sorting domain-containing protein [Aureivirga sp. CE67]